MLNVGRVQGSAEQARPLVIGVDTVYVHTNITKVEKESEEGGEAIEDLYEYDEVQYPKDEYMRMMSDSISTIEEALCDIDA